MHWLPCWKPNKRPDSHWLAKFKEKLYRRKQLRNAATDSQLIDIIEQEQARDEEILTESNDFFQEASKGWCCLDRDWRADYGFA